MHQNAQPHPVPAAPPARPAGAAKPSWSAPAVECHRTGAEVTAYAGRAAQWRNR
ncbi:pyrroloquinoline quinone precursor peptide PqqA [Kitasatospora sp. CM 4170]|uniref:Coenzyme PQQ synthesis protein A n=1 Tax=Kitasatospora aburaviensis TaxID=67265 RepID=A0ABW1F8Z5_9ACTN|nr:pyrroloquinoline quinone precursor peptide PqqA [Kitasatospora sp. CM 4170]WNM49393.1 pyrroloquinoline quinone precursor peptide PqqA [Kitasatospora sp. CM 4170]